MEAYSLNERVTAGCAARIQVLLPLRNPRNPRSFPSPCLGLGAAAHGDSGPFEVYWKGADNNVNAKKAKGKRSTQETNRRTRADGSRHAPTNVTSARSHRTARTSPNMKLSHEIQAGGRCGVATDCSEMCDGERCLMPPMTPKTVLMAKVAANGNKQRSKARSPGVRAKIRLALDRLSFTGRARLRLTFR